jgi:hypothetical protein
MSKKGFVPGIQPYLRVKVRKAGPILKPAGYFRDTYLRAKNFP